MKRLTDNILNHIMKHSAGWRIFAILAGLFGMIVGGYGILS